MDIRWQRATIVVVASWLAASCAAPGPDAGQAPAGECNPAPQAGRSQYIVGYGSLMQDESRKRTSPQAGPAHPVQIAGYRRGWFARPQAAGLAPTFLGAWPDRQAHFNGVIYQVEPDELLATDKRERSYCRAPVPNPDMTPLERDFHPAPDAQAWIYVSKPETVATPTSRYPIVQSYVDIFVAGCFEQEQRFGLPEFSRQCLSTTTDWSGHWVNDRIYPRRPFVMQPKAGQIDNLLSRELPRYFSQIRIEGG